MFQNLKRKLFGDNEADAKGPPSKIGNNGEDGNENDFGGDMDSSSSSSKVQESSCKTTGTQVDLKNDELKMLKAEFTSLHDAVVSNISCFKCGRLPRSLPITSCPSHHRLCDSCAAHNSGDQCSTCSSSLTSEKSPLLAALLHSVRRPC